MNHVALHAIAFRERKCNLTIRTHHGPPPIVWKQTKPNATSWFSSYHRRQETHLPNAQPRPVVQIFVESQLALREEAVVETRDPRTLFLGGSRPQVR